jgi:hypothetical protein
VNNPVNGLESMTSLPGQECFRVAGITVNDESILQQQSGDRHPARAVVKHILLPIKDTINTAFSNEKIKERK